MQFDPSVLEAAGREPQVALTTRGRRTGRPHRVTTWITRDDGHVFIRSGGGLGRDWTRNVLADDAAMLHVAGQDIPVRMRLIDDPALSRRVGSLIRDKYQANVEVSADGQPLTPGEQATFEVVPRGPAAG